LFSKYYDRKGIWDVKKPVVAIPKGSALETRPNLDSLWKRRPIFKPKTEVIVLIKLNYTYVIVHFLDAKQKYCAERVFEYFVSWNNRTVHLAGEN